MIEPALLIGFMATALIIELTPGPNMAWLVMLSLSEGRRAGYVAAVGIAGGLLFIAMLSAIGLAALISTTPSLYDALRWAGVLFLLFLAWEGWRKAGESSLTVTSTNTAQHILRGFVINALNPKAALFYVTVLPEFISREGDAQSQAFLLAVTSVSIATLVHISLVAGAGRLRAFIENEKQNRIIRRILSAGLVFVALWLFISTAR